VARTFDGSNDQIVYGSETAIDDLSAYTAFALVRVTGNVVNERTILAKFKSDYSAGRLFISAIGDGSSNNKIFTAILTNGSNAEATSVADVLVVNTWRVIVTTWPGVGVVAPKIYAGNLGGSIAEVSYVDQDAGSGTVQTDVTASLRVGTRDPLDTFYAGGLAEPAIWNRVLSTDEIKALALGFSPLFFPSGLVFHSPLDGRSSPEKNYAPTGVAGTVTEAAYLEHPSIIYPHYFDNSYLVSAPPASPTVVSRAAMRALGRALGRSF
jgi:hypothetical protein